MKTIIQFIAALALISCAAVQTQAPQTPEERVAYAQYTLNGVVHATAALVQSGRLDVDIAREIAEQERTAADVLRIARTALRAGDPATAQAQLRIAATLLQELNRRLLEIETKMEARQ